MQETSHKQGKLFSDGPQMPQQSWRYWPIWVVLFASLLVKLALINLNLGEYTDGIIQLQLWSSPVVFFPPGYSALVWLLNIGVNDLLIAGRLVSILGSVGALALLYSLAVMLFQNRRLALWAVLFLALSPVFNRWSLRVMTDSLFLFMFVACCRELYLLWKNENRPFGYLILLTGLAALVRYQGLYFVPFIVLMMWLRRKNLMGQGGVTAMVRAVMAALPWMALIIWILNRGFGHQQQFIERGSHGFWVTLSAYYGMFEGFVLYWPWAVTFGLFVLGLIGVVLFYRSESNKPVLFFVMITALVFLMVQSAFLSFQYRYLLPLVPLWCLLAVQGVAWLQQTVSIKWQQVVMGVVLANLVFMTAAVLYLQRSTFGDISASAKALQVAGKEARVLSDERYREGVYNVKMKFWSGRGIEFLYNTEPQVGDIVVLHNTYSDLSPDSAIVEQLHSQFEIHTMAQWRSDSVLGEYATLPLLPDIMVAPEGVPLTSNPPCMAFRFVPQHYYSIMIRLGPKP